MICISEHFEKKTKRNLGSEKKSLFFFRSCMQIFQGLKLLHFEERLASGYANNILSLKK